jgi:hypothetical protein
VQALLEFPDVHPYRKFWGTHWRLVSLADLGVTGADAVSRGVEQELTWLTSSEHRTRIRSVAGLVRRCASQEGNAVYACSQLGFATDPRVHLLVDSLIEWQWPDGGWNCDRRPETQRSSFHESVTPALGLAAYGRVTGDAAARSAATRTAELLLQHRLFRSRSSGRPIHPSWTRPHYPAYWHYDVLQGLRLLRSVELLGDPRCEDALDALSRARLGNGRLSGPRWSSRTQPDAVDWGAGPENEMLNLLAGDILGAAAR